MFQLPKVPPQQGALAMNIPNPMPTPALMAPMAKPMASAPKKEASVWDKDNRRRTFLAMAQAFGSNKNFFGGLGDAAGNVGSLMDGLKAKQKKAQPEIGGPDNSFEIHTDPETGIRTYTPIAAFQDYKRDSREKPKDVADLSGRAMYAIADMPEDKRKAAYDHMVQNPAVYGMEADWLPPVYDPQYVATRASMGSNVAQSRTRETAEESAASRERIALERLGIYRDRSGALTRQGDARIGLSAAKANAPKAPPSRRSGGSKSSAGGGGYETRIGPNGQVQRRKIR